MAHELEIAAGGSAAFILKPKPHHNLPPIGTPCANCATPLEGPWCYACGQSAEDFHRSIVRLVGEVIEGLLHFDGRLWRTLPDLMLRPARLTRAYLDGHRAPQIPPLRLFLVVLLGIFLIGGASGGAKLIQVGKPIAAKPGGKEVFTVGPSKAFEQMTPQERAQVQDSINRMKVTVAGDKPSPAATNWLKDRLTRTLADPERFTLILEQWSERFAFLMLPVSALLLSLLFAFQRKFYLFDHTIFSLHSLSAMGVVIILTMVSNLIVGDWAWLLLLPAPVHLFAHMRGVYRASIFGTLLRMALLAFGSVFAASVLVIGLIAVGLNGMGG